MNNLDLCLEVILCQRHTQTSLSHPPYIRRLLLVLAPDVTSCIVAALCSVCQSVSSGQSVSQSVSQ